MLSAESKEPYIAAFKELRAGSALPGPVWLEQLRQAGIASFDAMGFPTLKNEDWKYTNVEPIAAQSFAQANGEAKTLAGAEVFPRALIETDAPRGTGRSTRRRHGTNSPVRSGRSRRKATVSAIV
jgi:hypothetical protein